MRWRVLAPAKINRFLQIGERDAQGYHRLVTLFQTVGWWDAIEIERVTSSGPFQLIWDLPPSLGCSSEDTTLGKVLAELQTWGARPSGLWCIRLRKRIPIAAGLGGGSADAAAVLMALNEIWHLQMDREAMEAIARRVGMDVPFFLYGGIALGDRYGDRIWPLQDREVEWFVLIVPPYSAKTREMYRELDRVRPHPSPIPSTSTLLQEPTRLWEVISRAPNDFAPIIEHRWPSLVLWRHTLQRLGAQPVQWSGSGPALWGRFSHADEAWRAVYHLRHQLPHAAIIRAVPSLDRTAWRNLVQPQILKSP